MQHIYNTSGICARQIAVDVDDTGVITKVQFTGGCAGNLLGISKLVVGRKASEIIEELRGTKCGTKSTSCPDQLTYALEQVIATQR